MLNLIPRFINERYEERTAAGEFDAAVMFIDIVGFTGMTEDLMKRGKEGAEVLSDIINRTFGPVINKVYKDNGFFLYPAAPNPSDGSALISFAVPYRCEVNLELFDVKGRKIENIAVGELEVGNYEKTVNGLSSGLYLYQLTAEEFSEVKKMVVK